MRQETDFPVVYEVQRKRASSKGKESQMNKPPKKLPPDHFASMLDEVKAVSFDVIAPLSPEVGELLRSARPGEPQDVVRTLKSVIKNSYFLWSGTAGGRFVTKLSDNVAVRVSGSMPEQANHYAAYELLAEHAPDIPAPRPHGLIELGDLSVMFFSYIPGVTLEKAWPTLSQHQKSSLQTQMDQIITRIRNIPQKGRPLGLINGQGVVDLRAIRRDRHADKPLKTTADFEDWMFSYRPWVAETYVPFLQQLLPQSRFDELCVLTHCDLRLANIMFDQNENSEWAVTGIIDWEEAGFYPAYWESVNATRTFSPNTENDWFLMLPASISPSRYSTHWFVDRLWDEMMEKLVPMDKRVQRINGVPQDSVKRAQASSGDTRDV